MMDLNFTTNYTFNGSASVPVMPYNQDLIIALLLLIAACQLFGVIHILVNSYMEMRKEK